MKRAGRRQPVLLDERTGLRPKDLEVLRLIAHPGPSWDILGIIIDSSPRLGVPDADLDETIARELQEVLDPEEAHDQAVPQSARPPPFPYIRWDVQSWMWGGVGGRTRQRTIYSSASTLDAIIRKRHPPSVCVTPCSVPAGAR